MSLVICLLNDLQKTYWIFHMFESFPKSNYQNLKLIFEKLKYRRIPYNMIIKVTKFIKIGFDIIELISNSIYSVFSIVLSHFFVHQPPSSIIGLHPGHLYGCLSVKGFVRTKVIVTLTSTLFFMFVLSEIIQ